MMHTVFNTGLLMVDSKGCRAELEGKLTQGRDQRKEVFPAESWNEDHEAVE